MFVVSVQDLFWQKVMNSPTTEYKVVDGVTLMPNEVRARPTGLYAAS